MNSTVLERYKDYARHFDETETEMIRSVYGGSSFLANGLLARFVNPLSASEKTVLRHPEKVDLIIGNKSGSIGANARRWMEVNSYSEHTNINYIVSVIKIKMGIFGKTFYVSEFLLSRFVSYEVRADSMKFVHEREDGPVLNFGYKINQRSFLGSFSLCIYYPGVVDVDELDKAIVS